MLEEPSQIRIQLLGDFRVWSERGSGAEPRWRRKAAHLVKLLALAPEHKLHCERVLNHLWPDLPQRAAKNNLHRTLHLARHSLPVALDGFLRFRGKQLVLGPPERLWVDIDAFVEDTARARRSGDIGDYERAIARYTGDLLPEDPHEDWVATYRERLGELLLELLLELAHLYEDGGRPADALAVLERALERDPTLEEATKRAMRLQLQLGQRRQAVQFYERLQGTLHQELGAAPDEESRALYRQALGQRGDGPRTLEPGSVIKASPFNGRPLNSREKEVARLVAKGLSNKRIAEELCVGARTAETLVSRILRKLGVKSRHEIAPWLEAQDRGLR